MNSIYIQTKADKPAQELAWLNPYLSTVTGVYITRENGKALVILPAKAKGIKVDADLHLCQSEEELLTKTWELLKTLNVGQKEQLVTFNGRKFLAPFLYTRSFLKQVPAGNTELLRDRYKALSEHLDLVEALTFHHITASPSLADLVAHFKLPQPVLIEGADTGAVLDIAMNTESPQIWENIATSGMTYSRNILELAKLWAKTLRAVY